MLLGSALSGWFALACIPLAALVGWFLRRKHGGARMVVRLRPHYVVGYGALVAGLVHASFAMGSLSGATAVGIRFAVLALIAIAVQTFVGASLQDPGLYRRPLKAIHIAMLAAALVLSLAHAVLNGVLL